MRSMPTRTRAANVSSGLGAGDHVPALLHGHLHRDRVAVGQPLAELAALPVAEEHLAQFGLDDRLEPSRAASGAAV